MMSECWYDKPSCRLKALRVKKSLSGLMERLDIDKRQQFKAFQFGTINSSVVFSSLSSASFLSGKVEV